MKHTSYSFPGQEIDAGSILQASAGSLAPGPVPSWELWRRVWIWLPPISCQQSTDGGGPEFLGSPLVLNSSKRGPRLSLLSRLRRADWWWLSSRSLSSNTPWVLRTPAGGVSWWALSTSQEKELRQCVEGMILLPVVGSALVSALALLALGLTHQRSPQLHSRCCALVSFPEFSFPLLCLGLSSGLKCLPGGHLSSHRELCPSLPSSGKETLKKKTSGLMHLPWPSKMMSVLHGEIDKTVIDPWFKENSVFGLGGKKALYWVKLEM